MSDTQNYKSVTLSRVQTSVLLEAICEHACFLQNAQAKVSSAGAKEFFRQKEVELTSVRALLVLP